MVYEIDNLSTINRISGETIGVPTQNSNGFSAGLNFLYHLIENFSSGLLCAFAFDKFLYNFKIFSLGKFRQLRKLGFNTHHLSFLIFG
ncbi:hypothetical protein HY798_02535 [Candidatus Falkowbacteria bacterium]|nr:hypothetical protein [Candidatus Falkowbacteria bacterium]